MDDLHVLYDTSIRYHLHFANLNLTACETREILFGVRPTQKRMYTHSPSLFLYPDTVKNSE